MRCESCGRQTDFLAGFFVHSFRERRWRFECQACPGDDYDITIRQFFSSPGSTVDWLAHLSEKRWFNAGRFLEFVHRVRQAAGFEGRALEPTTWPCQCGRDLMENYAG